MRLKVFVHKFTIFSYCFLSFGMKTNFFSVLMLTLSSMKVEEISHDFKSTIVKSEALCLEKKLYFALTPDRFPLAGV